MGGNEGDSAWYSLSVEIRVSGKGWDVSSQKVRVSLVAWSMSLGAVTSTPLEFLMHPSELIFFGDSTFKRFHSIGLRGTPWIACVDAGWLKNIDCWISHMSYLWSISRSNLRGIR